MKQFIWGLGLALVSITTAFAAEYRYTDIPAGIVIPGTFDAGTYAFGATSALTINGTLNTTGASDLAGQVTMGTAGTKSTVTVTGFASFPNTITTATGISAATGAFSGAVTIGGDLTMNQAGTGPNITLTGATDAGADSSIILSATGADTVQGLKLWYDRDTAFVYFDNQYNNAAGATYFRTHTAVTPINALVISADGTVTLAYGISAGTGTFSGAVDIAGQTTIGAAATKSTFTVQGGAAFTAGIVANGGISGTTGSLSSTLDVVGQTTIGAAATKSTFTTAGGAAFSGAVIANGGATITSLTGPLTVESSSATVEGQLLVTPGAGVAPTSAVVQISSANSSNIAQFLANGKTVLTQSSLVTIWNGAAGGDIVAAIDPSGYSGDRVLLSLKAHVNQANNFFQIGIANPGDKFVIEANGDVGINEASPEAALEVAAKATDSFALIVSSQNASTSLLSVSATLGALNLAGGAKTKAAFALATPALGDLHQCSDCAVPYTICVATAATLGSYSLMGGALAACQ